jgi:hypothetical protein
MSCWPICWLPAVSIASPPPELGTYLSWSDEAHLDYARQESRILLTHNRQDFEKLARQWWGQQKEHAGMVIAIRRANTYELARHVLPVLVRYDQAGWRNCVMYA